MMKSFSSIIALFIFFFFFIAQEVQGKKWEFHRKVLEQRFGTAYWKAFWDDELWHLRAIFVDMDGDGLDEMIAITTSEEDRMGDYWKIWKYDNAGKFRQVLFSGDTFFSCHSESFYKMAYSDKSNTVVGLSMNANVEKNCGNGDRRIVRPTPDCKFVLLPGNKYMLREIQPDVDTSFRRKEVTSIERLYPEWYFGYDFKPPRDVPHNPQTIRMPYRLPKGDLRRGGGIIAADDFAVFVEEYRRKVKMKLGDKSRVTVFAVHLDADNDGDADCYVASNVERTDDGKFKWALYLRSGKTLSNAFEVVYPVENHRELCKLNPQVSASKDSFCRIIRFDVDPLFLILDDNAKGTAIRDAITGYETHRIEKLVCVEYPEKGK